MKLKLGKKDPSSNLCCELCAEEIHEGYFFKQYSEYMYCYHNFKEYYHWIYHYHQNKFNFIIYHGNSTFCLGSLKECHDVSFSYMKTTIEKVMNKKIAKKSLV